MEAAASQLMFVRGAVTTFRQAYRAQKLQSKTAEQACRDQKLQSETAEQELHRCQDDKHSAVSVPLGCSTSN